MRHNMFVFARSYILSGLGCCCQFIEKCCCNESTTNNQVSPREPKAPNGAPMNRGTSTIIHNHYHYNELSDQMLLENPQILRLHPINRDGRNARTVVHYHQHNCYTSQTNNKSHNLPPTYLESQQNFDASSRTSCRASRTITIDRTIEIPPNSNFSLPGSPCAVQYNESSTQSALKHDI